MEIITNTESLIGKTPLLRLDAIEKEFNLKTRIYGKLEMFNLTGSAKDRAAKYMIDQAEKDGVLSEGGTIIEPTSGNTGIGLAAIGTLRGYKVIIVMPDSMSIERIKLIQAYGAQVVLTAGAKGMTGAIEKANEIQKSTPGSWIADQFSNKANAQAHFMTTGPELMEALNGEIDAFVAGVGTGGTISGTGRYLKENCPKARIVAVQPSKSPVLTGGKASSHGIQGIGANFIPDLVDMSVIDEIMDITDEDALQCGKLLARKQAVLAGISSGAALKAAIELAKRPEMEGKNIVVFLVDSGSRYLSTALF